MSDTIGGKDSNPELAGDAAAEREPRDPGRREFIEKITGVVAGAGVAATAWPFISSMNPSRDVLARASTQVSLAGIDTGVTRTVEWRGKPVFVLHRTDDEIDRMQASQGSGIDPQPDGERVKKPEWLVVIGICTHLGCVPIRKDYGWFCPCHGSRYDNSGRVTRGPAPRNLDLPPYHFVSSDEIVIGEEAQGKSGGGGGSRG